MQSQQKKVKWSRGETSNALEERTDTGITNVSVARMENCVADVFGNVSRRPGLKLLPITDTGGAFASFPEMKAFTFSISKDDYLILCFGIRPSFAGLCAYRIKNRTLVRTRYYEGAAPLDKLVVNLSYVQQNNYAVISSPFTVQEIKFVDVNGTDFDLTFQEWKYSAGWYAPNGTSVTTIGSQSGYNWNADKLGAVGYIYTNSAGETIQLSTMDTGKTATYLNAILAISTMPPGSLVTFPHMGASMRIYEFIIDEPDASPYHIITSQLVTAVPFGGAVPPSGWVARIDFSSSTSIEIGLYNNGVRVRSYSYSAGLTVGIYALYGLVTTFSYVRAGETLWTSGSPDAHKLLAVGAMLTPIVNNDYTDTSFSITSGYESLMPDYNIEPRPSAVHPQVLSFSSQRLWAANFGNSSSLVIGSQIGKYNDLSNDYNGANEAITLDILTPYQEQVRYMLDYNGLKIFTDVSEWAYESGGVVKQSNNGIFQNCAPIVFHSVGVYVDATGRQVRAMSYELGANIFNSSIINKLCPNDLVFEPIKLTYLDEKQYSVGRFLFVLNNPSNNTTNPTLAVCNFAPDTQNMIWGRWTFPIVNGLGLIQEIVQTPTEPVFLVRVPSSVPTAIDLLPAVLDFKANADIEVQLTPSSQSTGFGTGLARRSLAGQTVSVFDNGIWQWDDTVNTQGNLTKSIAGLSNPSAGYMINAVLDSHPIDIGGKTKSVVKRISKAIMSVRDTEPEAITINGKTGYMNPAKDMINFYGITGMKREITYKITNIKGAKFHLESLLLNLEYGTLIS